MTALSNSITLTLDKTCEAASSSYAPQAQLSTPHLLKKTAPERPLSPIAAVMAMRVMVAMTLVALGEMLMAMAMTSAAAWRIASAAPGKRWPRAVAGAVGRSRDPAPPAPPPQSSRRE